MRRLLVLCVLGAVACGSGTADRLGGDAPSPSPSPPSSSLDLVGRWYVDVPGEPQGATSVIFGERLAVFLTCGVMDGEWNADARQGLFVADASSGDMSCFSGTGPPPLTWLTSARGFAVSGQDRLLLSEAGRTLAVLRPGARPTVGPNRADSYAAEPVVTDAMRKAAEEPSPLPSGAVAPTDEQLQRRWVPLAARPTKAYVSFQDDARWRGSDGCNGVGGAFLLGHDGRLLATVGGSTLIGCVNSPLSSWPAQSSRVGLVGSQLVFFDADAKELGRARAA
jgi:hypothetical protein